MKKFSYFSILIALVIASKSYAYKMFDSNILHECEDNIRFAKMKADCNDMYHHYFPVGLSSYYGPDEISIGGFNVFNMTTGQTRFKDLDIISDMINMHDVVGAVEVLPAMGDDAKLNDFIARKYDAGEMTLRDAKKYYVTPGYIKVLKFLRYKFPEANWGMVLAPYTQSATQELVAYFYKGNHVDLIPTSHCKNKVYPMLRKEPTILYWTETGDIDYRKAVTPRKRESYACIPKFDEHTEQQFSRIPFMASFKSGNFDFTLLSFHARFNAPYEIKDKCKEDCRAAIKQMTDDEFDPEGREVPGMGSRLLGKVVREKKRLVTGRGKPALSRSEEMIPEVQEALDLPLEKLKRRLEFTINHKDLSRFYEAKKIVEFMNSLKREREKDIILVGDFNLDKDYSVRNKADFWSYVLAAYPGSELYISEKTSLSTKIIDGDGLKSNYDHYLFNPKKVQECDPSSAYVFDFTDENNFKRFGLENKLGEYLGSSYRFDGQAILEDYYESLLETYVLKGSGRKERIVQLTDDEIEEELYDMQRRLFDSQDGVSMKVYSETLSDHLPIGMICNTSYSDDD